MNVKTNRMLVTALVGVCLAGVPAFAQEVAEPAGADVKTTETTETTESATDPDEIILDTVFRTFSPTGNQDWVREYDRKSYPFGDVGAFKYEALRGDTFYRVQLNDLFSDEWQSGNLYVDHPIVRFEGDYNALYHRLGVFRQSRVLNGQVDIARENSPRSLQLEVNPGDSYFMDRDVIDVGARLTPFEGEVGGRTELSFNWWNQEQDGQYLMRTRAMWLEPGFPPFLNPAGEHPTTWFTQPLARSTNDMSFGLDTGYGPVGLRYRYVTNDFNNNDRDLPLIASRNQAALPGAQTTWVFPDYKGSGHNLTLNSNLSDWGGVYVNWQSRDRENSYTGYKYDFSSFNAGLNASIPDWLFSVKYNSFNRDTKRNQSYTVLFPDMNNLNIGTLGLDRDRLNLDVRYTGLNGYNFGLGYSTDNSNRKNELARLEFLDENNIALNRGLASVAPVWNPSSTKNTWYARVNGRPTDWMDFRAEYRSQDADRDDYLRSTPGDVNTFTLDVNAYPIDWITFYGNLVSANAKANEYNYQDDTTQWTLGTSLYPRENAGFGIFYTREDGRQVTDMFWGGVSGARTIQVGTQRDTTYDYSSGTIGANALWGLTDNARLVGNYTSTSSRGTLPVSIFNNITILQGPTVNPAPGIYPNVLTGWNPLDITHNVIDLGFEWDMTKEQTIRFGFLNGNWIDRVLTENSGNYSVVEATWSSRW